jgi:hypothetical protein
MTVITHARRKSRLARMIDAPGGISVLTALTRAKANLEPLRARSLEEIARQIAVLAEVTPPAPDEDGLLRLEQLYRTANAVIDAAGPFELEDVCAAAAGLCDLIDAASDAHPFDWRVPSVFAGSLGLMMSLPDHAHEERGRIRQGLVDLVTNKLAQAG